MADSIRGFAISNLGIPRTHLHPSRLNSYPSSRPLLRFPASNPWSGSPLRGVTKNNRFCWNKVNSLPCLNLMAVMVQHVEAGKDLVTYKTIWHLSDQAIKNVYVFYIMFTCWGCLFFGSMKDPFYDSDAYREEGGDGTGHWVYEKQEDIEEAARAGLWKEELIEEIEQKVGELRELEETVTK